MVFAVAALESREMTDLLTLKPVIQIVPHVGHVLRDSMPLFWIIFFCTRLNLKLLESSRSRFQHRGQFP